MKPPLTERDHVERHHAAEHAPPRQAVAQHGRVADAVLQADDHDIGRGVPRNDIGHRDGIGALDRHQHHGGIADDRRIFRQSELVRSDRLIETLKARRPQAAGLDFADHARTRQQRHTTPAGHQHTADEAADAARPRDSDRPA